MQARHSFTQARITDDLTEGGGMDRRHGEDRTLLSWLVMQERVLALWIDEALGAAPRDAKIVAELETHHDWLAAQIRRLTKLHAS